MSDTDLLKKIGLKTWQFTYDRRMAYQKIRLFHTGYCSRLSDYFKVILDSEIFRVREGNVSVYYELSQHNQAFSFIQNFLLEDKSIPTIKEICALITRQYTDFIEDIKSKPDDYSSFSNQELAQAYNEFWKTDDKTSLVTWFLYAHFEEILIFVLKTSLEQHLRDREKVSKIISLVAKPSKITPLDMYTRDLFRIILEPESDYQKSIEEFSNKYISWGVYDVNYEIPDISFHESKLQRVSKEEAKRVIEEIDQKYDVQSKEVQSIKDRWKSEKHTSALLEWFSLYADFKDWKNYYRERSSFKLRLLLHAISKSLSLTLEQTSFLTEEETIGALSVENTIKVEEINQRIKNSAFVFLENISKIEIDLENLKSIDDFLSTKGSTTLAGTGAYPGFVRGTVRVILGVQDFSKVRDGDILVTSTTRPDYLPLMKKAGGFITNEGGLLSHAAILARELKKPCVIGTKVATQVLKDGDMVEVDAQTGIVKILK